jgi:hypothetical protein
MTPRETPPSFLCELAEFIASAPTREQLLEFRPSSAVIARVQILMARLKEASLAAEEERELDEFGHTESLIQLVKARIRAEAARNVGTPRP